MNLFRKIPLHPLILAAYPVLYLLAANLDQITPTAAVRPLLVSVVAAGVLLVVLGVVLRDVHKAALLVTLLLAAFFTYGHVLAYLKGHPVDGLVLGRHRYLALPYAVLVGLAAWRILRLRRGAGLESPTMLLNGIALVLLALNLVQLGGYALRSARASAAIGDSGTVGARDASLSRTGNLPDVYLIVLDSYARADSLQTFFQYDNSPFLNDLKQLGFRVADCSHSNYQTTEFSLASMLNLDYMDTFGSDFAGGDGPDGYKLPALIKENRVRQQLEDLGYQVTAFESGFAFTDWWGVDHFYAPDEGSMTGSHGLHPFEALLLKTSAASLLMDGEISLFGEQLRHVNFPYGDHINNVELTLSTLPTLPMQPSPKLVFAHIIVPHKPFVFTRTGAIQADEQYYAVEGDPINLEYYKKGYINQVEYINARILRVVRWLIQDSKTPPIIVVMGDHGYSWGDSTFANLAAFYLPGEGNADIYPEISNVNFFRVIFDRYFGTNFGLLADKAYFTDVNARGGFRLAKDCVTGCPLCKFEENKQ